MNNNENIHVFVRCRPLLKTELSLPVPVEVHPELNKVLVRDTGSDKCTVKSFTFDKIFGPEADQAYIYDEIVAPLVQEVIQGFNCTILAYGQTGTGKTFTIEGGRSTNSNDKSTDPLSGIIPRSMKHLLNDLSGQNHEVFVSFLELYNEEIFDLLSKFDDLVKLRMYENSSQKGSVTVQGLEKVPVKSMEEVYAILERGCKKRHKAATLLNKASSRSHTIFTITVNITESSSTLEKVRKGKLNLVDLAGSENIGRSGAINKRAREAGNINQSLLALGRVITSLCEKAGHIPYRESKLTRLLRDSLGGQTKAAVIATISPSVVHVDETLNTLEYALRAKSITNRPEVNTQVTVNSLIQDYQEKACRLRKGIYEMAKVKGGLYTSEENLKNWETSLEAKRELKFKLFLQGENLTEKNKELDVTIDELNCKIKENQDKLEYENCRNEEYKMELEKENKEKQLHEVMFQLTLPICDSEHEKFHEELKEAQKLESEVSKKKESIKLILEEKKATREKLEEILLKQKQWREKFDQDSENLRNDMREMNDRVNFVTAECSNGASMLKTRLDSRVSNCENVFENVFDAVKQLEVMNTNFQKCLNVSVVEEKSAHLKSIEEIENACVSSSESTSLKSLTTAISNCGSSLQSLLSRMTEWRKELTLEMDTQQKLVEEHVKNLNNSLEITSEKAKDLLCKQKENMEEITNIVSVSLEGVNKKMWSEKFRAIEQACSSLDIYCTESVKNEVDKTNQAHSSLKIYLEHGNEFIEKLSTCVESFTKNVDDIQNKTDLHVENIFSKKWKDLKNEVDSSCSAYKGLNSELESVTKTSQNFDGFCSNTEDLLRNTFKGNDQQKVATFVQMSDSITKHSNSCISFLTENRADMESALLQDKTHLEKIVESSKYLSDVTDSKMVAYIQCLETDLLQRFAKEDNGDNKTRNEESFLESNTTVMLDETVVPSTCARDVVSEIVCPICTNRTTDETLQADDNISMLFSKDSLKSPLKLPEAIGEASGSKNFTSASGSKSFMSVFPRSPVRRPRSKNKMLIRKNLQFTDLEKLTCNLWKNSSDED